MSNAQPWPQQQPWPGAPPPPPPPPGSGGKGAVPWLLGLIVLVVAAVVLSVATDKRTVSFGDFAVDTDEWHDLEGFDLNDLDDLDGFDLDSFEDSLEDDWEEFDPDPVDDLGDGAGGAPDPEQEAFAAVSAGDCLQNYETGDGWNSATPIAAECDSEEAVLTVTSVVEYGFECDFGNGTSFLDYYGSEGDIALCVSRQFHENYCMLATESGGEVTDANLMSLVDCYETDLPGEWNEIVQITLLSEAPEEIHDGACALYADDPNGYYYWLVDDEETLLCARVYPR